MWLFLRHQIQISKQNNPVVNTKIIKSFALAAKPIGIYPKSAIATTQPIAQHAKVRLSLALIQKK